MTLVKGTGRNITRIIEHCTATRAGQFFDAAMLRRMHTAPVTKGGRGFSDIGYHFVIQIDGTIETGRPENIVGAHVLNFNTGSIGVVYVGGLDAQGKPTDTRTPAQKAAQRELRLLLHTAYPKAKFSGHRDMSPDKNKNGKIEPFEWLKVCPCYDVRSEVRALLGAGAVSQ